MYSALSLNYPNLEVVVSDDNSSDDTLDRVKKSVPRAYVYSIISIIMVASKTIIFY